MTLKIGALELECMNELEAGVLADDVGLYFSEALTLVPGGTVIDVGANIGSFSAAVHQRLGGDVRLLAFEPMPPVFAVLSRNLERLGKRAKGFAYGLGSAEAEIELSYFPGMTLFSSAHRDASTLAAERSRIKRGMLETIKEGRAYPLLRFLPPEMIDAIVEGQLAQMMRIEPQKARIRPLSDVLSEEQVGAVDLLKIDVEGAELEVLAGVRDEHWPVIAQLVLECEAFLTRADEVRGLLEARGYSVDVRQNPVEIAADYGRVYARRQ